MAELIYAIEAKYEIREAAAYYEGQRGGSRAGFSLGCGSRGANGSPKPADMAAVDG